MGNDADDTNDTIITVSNRDHDTILTTLTDDSRKPNEALRRAATTYATSVNDSTSPAALRATARDCRESARYVGNWSLADSLCQPIAMRLLHAAVAFQTRMDIRRFEDLHRLSGNVRRGIALAVTTPSCLGGYLAGAAVELEAMAEGVERDAREEGRATELEGEWRERQGERAAREAARGARTAGDVLREVAVRAGKYVNNSPCQMPTELSLTERDVSASVSSTRPSHHA